MKNLKTTLTLFFLVSICHITFGQVNYTAKDVVEPYNDVFLFGSNFGYNPPWQDEELADIAAGNPALGVEGVGVKSSRPTLPGWFMEEYGYDFRVNTYQHYADLGLRDNVCIVGFPSDDQKEQTEYCPGIQSEMFANLYTPIWDGGANGTPYNDENYYARYLYKTVSMYKDHVKFWEIWNEPGFDYTGNCGWRPPGDPNCNWWDENPNPCDYKLRAPVTSYVRTLRISYEIIKTLDPDAYVLVAGVGFESFLDAVLRNTDNPADGSVTSEYPHGGGAYFDAMGFHSYPHFDGTMKYWDNSQGMFVYERHSDKGITGVLGRQQRYQTILDNYGFDGNTYPQKEWIITEINGPRKQFQDFVGSEEYQRNFIVKSVITCMRSGIRAMHVYNLAERQTYNEATGSFDLFGLYEKIKDTPAYSQVKTNEGVAYKTTSDLLSGSTWDANRTAQLNLPANIDGGAFLDPDGNYTYVLWAKTTQDMSESASANYSFPQNLNINFLEKRDWEFSKTFESSQVDPNNIQLTGAPAFFTESIFSTDVSSGCEPLNVNFTEQFVGNAMTYQWAFEGGTPAISTDPNPSVTFQDAGTYSVTLEVLDGGGNVLATQTSFIVVKSAPAADFNVTVSGPIVVFENLSSANATNFTWVMGDGGTSDEEEPTYVYSNNGSFNVTLIAANGCGASTLTQTVTINASSNFQLPFNANTTLNPYDGPFRFGTNFGYNPPWNDKTLADIAGGNPSIGVKGVGVKASRPTLPGWFVSEWGYDFNLSTYEHYDNLGIEENVCIIGFPGPSERDQAFYCNGVQSEMFANMYSDIWDGGANGTPYNDDNYLAAYLYKVVEMYGDDIRFWEIWNEPGFDYTGNCGWREPGDPVCNWWDQNPDPCDYKLRAPVMHYVRILRISYEIIKTLQPEDYLVVAGVGFPSFLDAILRNTDNPVDGSPTADYPLGGGAYFDVMGFHAYPHFDGTMRWWDNSVGGFVYARHSDQAITSITNRQNLYQNILENYGYDGNNFPKKEWIITESNLPRKEFQDYIGNEDAQINYMIKAVVTCYKQNIHQFHVYNLGEAEYFDIATREFDLMGLYQRLLSNQPYTQIVNQEGIAYKTSSDILFGSEYDPDRTAALGLPSNLDGAALKDGNGNYVYVLWAKTTQDQSEAASGTYSFPNWMNISQLYKKEWDFSETNWTQTIGPNDVQLSGRPIFLLEVQDLVTTPTASFFPDQLIGCAPLTINFNDMSHSNISNWNWTVKDAAGNVVNTFTDQNPSMTFNDAGIYTIELEVSNAAGSNTTIQTITVEGQLTGGFTYIVNGNSVQFTNTSMNGNHYSWDFGDQSFTDEESPEHTYLDDGLYNVGLTVSNSCDTIVISQMVEIGMGSGIPPTSDFAISLSGGCGPVDVDFINLSTGATSFLWTFPGGNPTTSTEMNPTVTYSTPGVYDVTLEATNGSGTTTFTQNSLITILGVPTPSYSYSLTNSPTIDFTNNSLNGVSFFWDFGDGNSSTLENPVYTYANSGVYEVSLTAANGCGSATITQIINIDGGNLPPTAGFTSDNINGCLPMTINFADNSQNATSWNWSFPGGNPSSSTEQNPSVTYDQVGIYDVTLEVSNANGSDVLTQNSYITIFDIPTSGYTYVVQDSMVTFTNMSTGALSYSWNFDDGTFSTEENPVHIYGAPGVYEVVLTAANGCGSSMTTFFVEIVGGQGVAPSANFTADVTSGCLPVTVNFTDLSSDNATAWSWSFPGGTPSTSTEQHPTVVYDQPGIYNVTLEVSNNFGNDIATQTSYIAVSAGPSVGFNSSVNTLTVSFNNTSTNATSYEWDFGDGNTSTDADPAHTYDMDGTYTVTLTATNDCGSVTTTEEVTVVSLPVIGFTSNVVSGCAPLEVNFEDLSSSNVTNWSWSFPGGTPSSSTEQHPSVIYNTAGTYNVTLVGSNAAGNSSVTQTAYIVIGDVPDASFGTNVSSLMANFNNTSTNATSYTWDFGDGNSSSDTNPSHTYSANGTYLVTLTATNDCGSVTTTETITVQFVGTAPTAAFSANVTTGCAPLTVNFIDQSSGDATAWSWSFPGGNPATSTDQNPTVMYDMPGMYDVVLVVSNAAGSNTATQTSMIIVNTTPSANFTSDANGSIVSFTNNSTGATSYSWDFGDGNSSTDMNPTHDYMMDGTYTVTLSVTNDCGTVTTTETIDVVTAPTVAFSADTLMGCAPLTVNFINQSSPNVDSYFWEMPGATPATSTDENPSVTYDMPGTYDVTLTVTNASGSYPLTQAALIVVNTAPTADFAASQMGAVVSFTNNSMGGATYLWDFGDGNSSTDENPTHSYAMNGTYTVALTVTNECGTMTTTQEITVEAAPSAAFSADTTFGCVPLTVQFTDQSTNATAWDWEFEGGTPGTSTDQNPLVTYDMPGTYSVSLTASNNVGMDNVTINSFIVVQDEPTAEFFYNIDTTSVAFNNTSIGGTTYDWDFGDGNSSMEESPTHNYTQNGVYTVILTVTNDCGTMTYQSDINITYTDIDRLSFIEEFQLFPNPNGGQFTILLKGQPKEDLQMNLMNVLGQRLHNQELDFSTGDLVETFYFNDLPAGTYIVELKSDLELMYRKVVIE